MKQEVISYEYQILQNQLIRKSQLKPVSMTDSHRYSAWKLNELLQQLTDDSQNYTVKWIGNSTNSDVMAYFYCVILICSHKADIMMQLKHSIYKFCQYCLNLAEQRFLVEFMNLLQTQPNISFTLKNNPHIEELLVKIYQCSLNMTKINSDVESFQKLILYTKKLFPFLYIYSPKDQVLGIRLEDHEPVYILREKECYFVYCKQKNTSRNCTKQIVTICEEAQQDTIIVERSKRQEEIQETTKEKEKNIPKTPKFIQNSKLKKQRNSTKVEDKKQNHKIILPIKHNFHNKIITNFEVRPKISNKSEQAIPQPNKRNNSNKNISPASQAKRQSPAFMLKHKQKSEIELKPIPKKKPQSQQVQGYRKSAKISPIAYQYDSTGRLDSQSNKRITKNQISPIKSTETMNVRRLKSQTHEQKISPKVNYKQAFHTHYFKQQPYKK